MKTFNLIGVVKNGNKDLSEKIKQEMALERRIMMCGYDNTCWGP